MATNKAEKLQHNNKILGLTIGIGMVLFAIHSPTQPFLQLIFLPALGMILIVAGTGFALMLNWGQLKLGPKIEYIPLALLALSIAISGIVNAISLANGVAMVLFGGILFGLYLISRTIGKVIFAPFLIAVIIEAVSCIVYGVWITPGQKLGGLVSTSNYAMAATFLVFGAVIAVCLKKWVIPIILITLVGLFFTGAPEAVFVVGVLGIAVLVRRDWNRRLWIAAGVVVIACILWFMLGSGSQLYTYLVWAVQSSVGMDVPLYASWVELNPISGRWIYIVETVRNLAPFGHGYTLGAFTNETVHNVPMVIVDQIGISGAVAWTFAVVCFLIRTKWKYAFVAVLALSVFDHAVWTQVAPWFWCLCGVASTSDINSDLIFRKDKLRKEKTIGD